MTEVWWIVEIDMTESLAGGPALHYREKLLVRASDDLAGVEAAIHKYVGLLEDDELSLDAIHSVERLVLGAAIGSDGRDLRRE